MANRQVVVDLIVNTTRWTAGFRSAAQDMSSATTNMETKTRAATLQFTMMGVAAVGAAGLAVKKWADFDQAMSRVRATGGEAAQRIGELNELAKSDGVIQLGYNMTQASDSIYELVKAGVSATDILAGGMSGALALAAAETMDAGEAASIMASALTQFNLNGSDSAHVADLITAAAGKAQGSAHDLGFALKQSGLVANQFGLSIEETSGSLAFFASAGLIGSDAGTSLRTMLLHLAGPSTKAAKLMNEIGLEVYGANGKMVSMETLANNLQSSLGKLSEEQRNQALATIFGSDATRAASLLYREGGDAVADWTEKVNDAGYAQEVARERMDNLNGDLTKLSASWDRMLAGMGEGADSPLRKLTQGITGVVDTINDMPPAVKGAMTYLTGGAGLLILGAVGFKTMIGQATAFISGLKEIGLVSEATAGKMTTGFGKITKAAGLATIAIAAIAAGVEVMMNATEVASLSAEQLAGGWDAVSNKWNQSAVDQIIAQLHATSSGAQGVSGAFRDTAEGVGRFFGVFVGGGMRGVDSAVEALDALGISTADFANAMVGTDAASEEFRAGLAELYDMIISNNASTGAYSESTLALAAALGVALPDNIQLATGAAVNLRNWTKETSGAMDEQRQISEDQAAAHDGATDATEGLAGATEGLAGATEGLSGVMTEAEKAAADYHESLVNLFNDFTTMDGVYQGAIDKNKEWAKSQADSTKSAKDSWEDFYNGQDVSVDQYLAELTRQVEAQEQWAANVITLTSRAANEMPPMLRTAAQEMVNELQALGPKGAEQIALLNSMSQPKLQEVVELYQRQGVATGEEWATGVGEAQNPEVEVETEQAEEDIRRVGSMILQIPDGSATVDVNTSGAMRKLADLRSAINAAAGKNVPIPYQSDLMGRATGGAIFGPGTGTSDSIPALLSNGEHVWTASDVQKAGGQEAVYQLRAAVQAGMLKFAGGGGVLTFGAPRNRTTDPTYWQRAFLPYLERLKLLTSIGEDEERLRATGDDAITGARRRILELEIEEDKEKLREAEWAANQGDQKYWDKKVAAAKDAQDAKEKKAQDAARAKEKKAQDAARAKEQKAQEEERRLAAVAGYKEKVSTDISRGNITDSMTKDMGGVYSVTDQARGYLDNLTGSSKTNLAKAITAAEKAAKGLYAQLDSVDEKLKDATDKAAELRQIKDSVATGIAGGFSLGTMSQTSYVDPFTGKVTGRSGTTGQSMLASAQAYAAKAKAFAGKLQALQGKGFAGKILQEIAGMGVDAGSVAADALLSLSTTDVKAMNTAYQDIEKWASTAGEAVTGGFYEGGLKAADGIVAGLEANKDKIEASILGMAVAMQDALKKALGIKSPSRKFRDLMRFVGQGVSLGLDDQKGIIADASARMFDNVGVPASSLGLGLGAPSVNVAPILDGVSQENLDYLADRIVAGFEVGTARHLDRYTSRQNLNRLQTYGTR